MLTKEKKLTIQNAAQATSAIRQIWYDMNIKETAEQRLEFYKKEKVRCAKYYAEDFGGTLARVELSHTVSALWGYNYLGQYVYSFLKVGGKSDINYLYHLLGITMACCSIFNAQHLPKEYVKFVKKLHKVALHYYSQCKGHPYFCEIPKNEDLKRVFFKGGYHPKGQMDKVSFLAPVWAI